jgi:hypothetical protein
MRVIAGFTASPGRRGLYGDLERVGAVLAALLWVESPFPLVSQGLARRSAVNEWCRLFEHSEFHFCYRRGALYI